MLTYENAFEKFDLGRGAAVGVMWMLILVVISLIFNRMSSRESNG
jgi:multiple sugar transport system permease protein